MAVHGDWMRLVDVSGPFLEESVLDEVMPQGLVEVETEMRQALRLRLDEWQADARTSEEIHRAWIRYVLDIALGYESVLQARESFGVTYDAHLLQHRTSLGPDFVVLDDQDDANPMRALVTVYAPDQALDKALPKQAWKASPLVRMEELLRHQDDGHRAQFGIVTNGGEWALVHVADGEASTHATWQAELWSPEKGTLRAFVDLLGVRRTFGAVDERLPALFARSNEASYQLTDKLGMQVRRAVERLVQGIDDIDRSRDRELLKGYEEKRLYEACVSVMMRTIFVFYAEENGLLPLDNPFYHQHYALSPLRDQLDSDRDRLTEDVVERRHAAWGRMLATFRAMHAGVTHEQMRMPAYGGKLFDPDEYPFLEGRVKGTQWRDTPADPLPIDDLTVLQLLESLQQLEAKGGGKRTLSFRSLDVEQIGHVYEGLIDHTAVRALGPVLGLVGPTGLEPEVPLDRLEKAAADGANALTELLREQTGKAPAVLSKLRARTPIEDEPAKWHRVVGNDQALLDRIRPFAGVMREERGEPVLIHAGSVYVTQGSVRRSTGTHYTPRSLTEPLVQHALEPLVYDGPAEGKPEAEWQLRSPRQILSLRVCDMAVGSAAFLVQACRYLADKLVESWALLEQKHQGKVLVSPEGELVAADEAERPVPRSDEERIAVARRAIADRCLYGVDIQDMAVEMAKLSLWLITLQKDRPFTFLDHAIRHGDGLLGLHDPEQLVWFHLDPDKGRKVHRYKGGVQSQMRRALEEAQYLRQELERTEVVDIAAAQEKEQQLLRAQELVADLQLAGDLLVGVGLEKAGRPAREFDERVQELGREVAVLFDEESSGGEVERVRGSLREQADRLLEWDGGPRRQPMHWALEFPEVFAAGDEAERGLSAVVGNPPFIGGKRLSGAMGKDYREFVRIWIAAGRRGNADLVALFFLRAYSMLQSPGQLGFLATNTIAQGDTREVGLDQIEEGGGEIIRAIKSRKWPGEANLEVAHVWLRKGAWHGAYVLDEEPVRKISTQLAVPGRVSGQPHRFAANAGKSFIGSYVLGMGFVLDPDEAKRLFDEDPRNKEVVLPYLVGKDVNSRPDQSPSRWVINFRDWPEDRAREYPDVFRIVEEQVKSERADKAADVAAWPFWQHWRSRPELYSTIEGLERVLVTAQTSRTQWPVFVPPGIVYGHKLIVFPTDRDEDFCLLASAVHHAWVVARGSTMRTDTVYTPSDCLETFPMPLGFAGLAEVGSELHGHRASCCAQLDLGLTGVANRVNDPGDKDDSIEKLRDLLVRQDVAVLAAYGWSDLKPDHGFFGVANHTRFTLSPAARREVLDRLLELNFERHAAETGATPDVASASQPRQQTFGE